MSQHEAEQAKRKIKTKIKKYEKELRKLQDELCRLQEWVVQVLYGRKFVPENY